MINNYPYTDYHSMNLDYLIKLAHETMGLHLVVEDDKLKLVNQNGTTVSSVTVAYAEKAMKDADGNNIDLYVFGVQKQGNYLVFTHGNGTFTTLTVPYAETAEKDVNDRNIISYVRGVGVSGNKLLVTFGDNTTYSFTVPFATDAKNDKNGKDITTYVAGISTVGDKLVFVDGAGNTISEITSSYATSALNDVDGDAIKATYGATLSAGTTTIHLRNKNGDSVSEITVPYSVKALKDADGNIISSSYGSRLAVNGTKIALESRDGSTLNEITVPFATASQDANNAIEAVTLSGDSIVFVTFGGQSLSVTIPYAVKALKDSLNNTISHAYVANVTNDPNTGKITFLAPDGTQIAELTPTVDSAVHDNYNNEIADYIKTIVTSANSNYVTVTHGDGTVDSLTINYSTTALKDTYGNIIGNVYVKRLVATTDSQTGKPVIVAYNGEGSELFRFSIESTATAYATTAEKDTEGNDITDYINDISVSGHTMTATHGDGTTDSISLPNDSCTLRTRINATADGWKGYAPDPTAPNVEPYPIVEELLDSNGNVISQIPVPSLYPNKVPISYNGTIPAWGIATTAIDFWYDSDDWRKMFGTHNVCDAITILECVSEDPYIIPTVRAISSIAGANPDAGFSVQIDLHNFQNQSYTPADGIYITVALGKSYN